MQQHRRCLRPLLLSILFSGLLCPYASGQELLTLTQRNSVAYHAVQIGQWGESQTFPFTQLGSVSFPYYQLFLNSNVSGTTLTSSCGGRNRPTPEYYCPTGGWGYCSVTDGLTFLVSDACAFALSVNGSVSSTHQYQTPRMRALLGPLDQGAHLSEVSANYQVGGMLAGSVLFEWHAPNPPTSVSGTLMGSATGVIHPGRYEYQALAEQSVWLQCTTGSADGQIDVSLTLRPCTTVLAEPQPVTTCQGQTISFTYRVEGVPELTRQWRRDGVPLTDISTPAGSVISGCHLETLIISNVDLQDSGQYDCVVTSPIGLCTDSASLPASLVVRDAPVITSDPRSASKCFGDSHEFSVEPSAAGVQYSWRRVGDDEFSAAGPSLTFSNLRLQDFGSYYCILSNASCSVTSATATLQRLPGPAFFSSASHGACVGFPVVLEVETVGPVARYEWFKDSAPLTSVTTNSNRNELDLGPVSLDDAGFYECIVHGPGECGWARTTLTVSVFDTIPTITDQPDSTTGCIGGTATLRVVGSAHTFQWRKNDVEVPGANSPDLVIEQMTIDDAGVYTCVLSDFFFCGSIITDPATLTVCPADLNCSNSLTVQDIFDFLTAYFSNDPRGDFNGSGLPATVQDIFDFLAAYFAGCS